MRSSLGRAPGRARRSVNVSSLSVPSPRKPPHLAGCPHLSPEPPLAGERGEPAPERIIPEQASFRWCSRARAHPRGPGPASPPRTERSLKFRGQKCSHPAPRRRPPSSPGAPPERRALTRGRPRGAAGGGPGGGRRRARGGRGGRHRARWAPGRRAGGRGRGRGSGSTAPWAREAGRDASSQEPGRPLLSGSRSPLRTAAPAATGTSPGAPGLATARPPSSLPLRRAGARAAGALETGRVRLRTCARTHYRERLRASPGTPPSPAFLLFAARTPGSQAGSGFERAPRPRSRSLADQSRPRHPSTPAILAPPGRVQAAHSTPFLLPHSRCCCHTGSRSGSCPPSLVPPGFRDLRTPWSTLVASETQEAKHPSGLLSSWSHRLLSAPFTVTSLRLFPAPRAQPSYL